jgi:hypothetical protein
MKYPVLQLEGSVLRDAPIKSPVDEQLIIDDEISMKWADSLEQETWSELRTSPTFIRAFTILWGSSLDIPDEDIYWVKGAGSGVRHSIGIIGLALIEGGINRKQIKVTEAKNHLHFLIQKRVPVFLVELKRLVIRLRGFNVDGTMRVDIEETKRKIRL